ncbi:hypothetical protein [Streptomyces sp. NPDC046727]|uniref:hypothetical protein n=1 Tax=Streptomyces sp. NPDC046727 TaxID=3155373 RepID=UPI0033EABD89
MTERFPAEELLFPDRADVLECAAGIDVCQVVTDALVRHARGAGEGYLTAAWLRPGTFVAHVSLSDLLPDALLGAQALYVDDVDLVADNPRRVLGTLMRDGRVTAREPGPVGGRGINGTLGQVLAGVVPAVRPGPGHVVSNPFGMAVLDVALLGAVHEVALRHKSGRRLRLC